MLASINQSQLFRIRLECCFEIKLLWCMKQSSVQEQFCVVMFSHIRTSLILELLVSIRVNTYWIVLDFDTSSRQHYVPNIVCTRTDMHKTVTTVTRFKPAVYWPTSSHKRQ